MKSQTLSGKILGRLALLCMVFHFVVLICESDLMNSLDSWMYMGDVYLYEEMNGLEHMEAEELKKLSASFSVEII